MEKDCVFRLQVFFFPRRTSIAVENDKKGNGVQISPREFDHY